MKKREQQLFKKLVIISSLFCSLHIAAAPIVVDGVVPNDMTKQAILEKLRTVYGADQVVDKIQIRPVSAPNGWSDSVTRVITPDLKKINQGKLSVRGTQVDLAGKMVAQADIQPTTVLFQSLVQPPYRFNSQITVNAAEQAVIDSALKNRIIEFESGKAVLTPIGTQILDEMVVALNKVQNKNIKIVGHTDSQGDPQKNLALSLQRAEAVKQYLIAKNVAPTRLTTQGLGATKPVADNATEDGRKKNRRIEFDVL
ncbi:MAG: OmpA family protein [Acinetobacter sp.]